MPRLKRWFKVNQDINADPKCWELTRRFGLSGLRAWLEILSIADRNEGILPGPWKDYARLLAARCQSTTRHLVAVNQWLTNESADGQEGSSNWVVVDTQGIARVPKWSEYNRIREYNPIPSRDLKSSPPSEPSEPSLKTVIPKGITSPSPGKPQEPGTTDWAVSLQFIKEYLKNGAPPLTHPEFLLDNDWWVDVYDSLQGIDRELLSVEMAKMSTWLNENPSRRPVLQAKSYKRFVRTWLMKAKEQGRKSYGKGT